MAAKTPRRGKGAKLPENPQTKMSVADAFFPGGDDSAAIAAASALDEPIKGRRGRKPKLQPAPNTLTTEDERTHAISSPAKDDISVSRNEPPGTVVDQPSPSSMEIEPAPSAPQSAAVRWDAATGLATFDWPSIEQVATMNGPNQGMAKLLLAARAEGANSRWPF